VAERIQQTPTRSGRKRAEKPDHWHCGLLRACRERPRDRYAADNGDEIAPSHVFRLQLWRGLSDGLPRNQGITARKAGPWATPEMF
jgi:hypothetical protein